MKKLIAIFLAGSILLYTFSTCFAQEQSDMKGALSELPLALSSESTVNTKNITEFEKELQQTIALQNANLNILYTIQSLGFYHGSFDGLSLKSSMAWDRSFVEAAPLFSSDIYKSYYKLRTEQSLRKYHETEQLDYTSFYTSGRKSFDSYIKSVFKKSEKRDQLIVLLQEKLTDKLVELEPVKRKLYVEEILALRQAQNTAKSMELLYQLFESRVRLELLTQIANTNAETLGQLGKAIPISIFSSKNGALTLTRHNAENKPELVLFPDIDGEQEGYRGATVLHELYDNTSFQLSFKASEGSVNTADAVDVLAAINLNQDGFLQLNLDLLFEQQPIKNLAGDKAPAKSVNPESRSKTMQALYQSNSQGARSIVKELTRYQMYLELKSKNISNYYTRTFEAQKNQWKKSLEAKISAFGGGGAGGLLAYTKSFALLDRETNKLTTEKALIAKYRNTDIQFKSTENGVLWMTDMLYKLKYLR